MLEQELAEAWPREVVGPEVRVTWEGTQSRHGPPQGLLE